jgi:hypothetical protein
MIVLDRLKAAKYAKKANFHLNSVQLHAVHALAIPLLSLMLHHSARLAVDYLVLISTKHDVNCLPVLLANSMPLQTHLNPCVLSVQLDIIIHHPVKHPV